MAKRRPSNPEFKRWLFAQGAESARRTLRVDPDVELDDLYLCPLCLEAYEVDSVDDKSLTLEHVPPRSIGGKALLLTCDGCNNDAGTRLDPFASNQYRLDNFRAGTPGATMRLRARGVAAAATNTAEGMLIELIESQSPPERFKEVLHGLNQAANDGSPFELLDVEPVLRLDAGKAASSYIRAAYLVLFALYGYRFVFQDVLGPVRSEIRNGRPTTGEGAIITTGAVPGMPALCAGRLMHPEPLTCMFARFNGRTVLLPSYGSSKTWHQDLRAALQDQHGVVAARFLVHSWPTRPVFFSDELQAQEWKQVDLSQFAARITDQFPSADA